jgi:hypothetical protein
MWTRNRPETAPAPTPAPEPVVIDAPAGSVPRTITAASTRITSSREYRQPPRGAWQNAAWAQYDSVGELRAASQWLGQAMSRATLSIEHIGPDGKPDGLDVPMVVSDLMAGWTGDVDHYQMLLATIGSQFTVVGEFYLIAQASDLVPGGFAWTVGSTDEVTITNGVVKLDRGDGNVIELDEQTSIVIRVWRPHPRRWIEADAATRAAWSALNEVAQLTAQIDAHNDSRLAGAGILFIPSTIRVTPPSHVDVDEGEDPFGAVLADAMLTPLRDRGSASSVVPIVITADADDIAAVRHLTFSTSMPADLVAIRDAAVRRCAVILDMPPEALLGMGDVNHWSSWQITEQGVKTYIAPALSVVAASLMSGYFAPALTAAGLDPASYHLVFDTTELTTTGDRSADARELWDRGALATEVLLDAHGFEGDGPTDQERLQRLLWDIARTNPELLSGVLSALGIQVSPSLAPPAPAPAVEAAPAPAVEPSAPVPAPRAAPPAETAPGTAPPPAAGATASLVPLARLAVDHALGRAANRRQTRAQRATLAMVAPAARYQRMDIGPDETGHALAGAWDDLPAALTHLPAGRIALLASALDEYTATLLTSRVPVEDADIERVIAGALG